MAVPASTRDLTKAISAFIQSPALPLPDELNQVIEGYLEKHEKYDEAAADRLNDELLAIYQKSVQDRPERYAPFLAILRPLRAAIRSPARILQWWDRLAGPVLDQVVQQKGLAKEALAATLNLLVFDDGDAEDEHMPNPFAERLLKLWMDLSQARRPGNAAPDPVKANILRETLLMFGKKVPRDFMMAIDTVMVKKEYRAQSLTLLCEFLSSQPPHLHQVLRTPLLGNILQCLQQDTSTTVVALALSALIMFLPNMPSSLVPFLPSLFNIYARLLFWDKERSAVSESLHVNPAAQSAIAAGRSSWDRCLYAADLDGPSVPHLEHYFTMLYGLYPINFVDYIRKPQRYLRHANNTEDVEVQPTEIRDRSERFRRCHLLHSNFYTMTIDSEKTDFGRWMKAGPADVVAECIALSLPSDPTAAHRHGSAMHPDAAQHRRDNGVERASVDPATLDSLSPEAALATDSSVSALRHSSSTTAESSSGSADKRPSERPRRSSQSSSHQSSAIAPDGRVRGAGDDSPTLPPNLGASGSQTQLQDMIQSNKAIKSSLHQSLTNDSVPSLALSHQDSIPERSSVRLPLTLVPEINHLAASASETNVQIAQLYRQLLLVQNDLNFERYMKEQHLAHIGELRGRQVREARSEAELQNLVETNRLLKKRLEEAKRSETKIKKETDHRRTMASKWESELSGKLRTLRDEQKRWTADGASLRREVEAARDKYDRLRRLVAEAEDKELKSKQQEQAVTTNADELERLKAEVQRLSEAERDYQGKERSMHLAIDEAAEASSRAEKLVIELNARDYELEQAKSLYEAQIAALTKTIAEAAEDTTGKHNADRLNARVQKALEASRAKQAELQKQYSRLTQKYTVLQSSLLEMATNPSAHRLSNDAMTVSDDADGEVGAFSFGSTPTTVRTRIHRGFSDPEMLETSYNVTPPLDAMSIPAGALQRPSTPSGSGSGAPDSSGLRNSPGQGDRYYGRGGVQNTIRKDKKEKKPEADKKDRKTSGIRGIRGFV